MACRFFIIFASGKTKRITMRLTTPVNLPKRELDISYATRQMIIGSCFAENIGGRFAACKFPVMLNPFGILYNPLSIAAALERIAE